MFYFKNDIEPIVYFQWMSSKDHWVGETRPLTGSQCQFFKQCKIFCRASVENHDSATFLEVLRSRQLGSTLKIVQTMTPRTKSVASGKQVSVSSKRCGKKLIQGLG